MRSKSEKTKCSSKTRKQTCEFTKKLLCSKTPTLTIIILGLKCNVDVNDEIYSKNDKKRISQILNHMSKEIWIDKTYVNFPGNRWKDSFIVEDKWYEFIRTIVNSNFGRTASKKENDEIMSSIILISMMYLYRVLENFGYDIDSIDISFNSDCFKVIYEEDNRTSWNS